MKTMLTVIGPNSAALVPAGSEPGDHIMKRNRSARLRIPIAELLVAALVPALSCTAQDQALLGNGAQILQQFTVILEIWAQDLG